MCEISLSLTSMQFPSRHLVKHAPSQARFSQQLETAVFGKGYFSVVEQGFGERADINTAAAACAGACPEHPTYGETYSTQTGQAELALVIDDPAKVSCDRLLDQFRNGHEPIRSVPLERLSKDQYRSMSFTTTSQQRQIAPDSRVRYETRLLNCQYVTT